MKRRASNNHKRYWSTDEDDTETSNNNTMEETAPPTTIPQFALSEVNLGKIVGTGGFSVVHQIKSIDLDEIYDVDAEASKARKSFSQSVRGQKFVLKQLRSDLCDEDLDKGITDLAIEADFLKTVTHSNIIDMRGCSASDPTRARYFVVLDELTMTLERKVNFWRKIVSENTGYWVPCYGYCCANSAVLHELWKERFHVAEDIASAIQYLHNSDIVYRDLKPDNIGFDAAGTVKLFDFGLAKRLGGVEKSDDENYLLTGNTGSLRYMAPEVALDLPYNKSVDVYSFGVLFWQICSLSTPYAGFTSQMHALQVVQKGLRPIPHSTWPYSWVSFMKSAWHSEPSQRPSDIHSPISNMLQQFDFDGLPMEARIRAKTKRRTVTDTVLDVDTRVAKHDGLQKQHDADIV